MVNDLSAAGVRYVLTGSVAAAAYGVPVEPRDLHIAPPLDPENLARLARLPPRRSAHPVPDRAVALLRNRYDTLRNSVRLAWWRPSIRSRPLSMPAKNTVPGLTRYPSRSRAGAGPRAARRRRLL